MKNLVFFVTMAIIIVAIIIYLYEPELPIPTTSLRKIRHLMKNGDVILTHSPSKIKASLMNGYLGCAATHVAMVFEKDGILHTIEISPYWTNLFKKTNVVVHTLDDFLKKSGSKVFGYKSVDYAIEFGDRELEIYKDYTYNYFIPTMFKPYSRYKVCSSFVAMIHEDFGLTKEHHIVTPCDYCTEDVTYFKL